MDKRGLVALAETYGLDRRELQQLKLLAEGFFDELRELLVACAGTTIRLSGLTQSISTFKEVCSGVPASHVVILGADGAVAVLTKADPAFSRALVGCVISSRASSETTERALTAVEEYLLINSMTTACSQAARRRLAAQLGFDGELRRIEQTVAESFFDSTEQMVRARITCQIGGVSGSLELALPFSRIVLTRALPVLTDARDPMPPERKARERLADASAELVAVIGQVMMPLDVVRALGPGSILALRPFNGGVPKLELHCGHQVLFSGAVVEHRGWRRFLIQQTGVSE